MGDADQHREAGVQLFLKRGAWQAWPSSDTWLPATPGWACASWRCARASHRARPLLGCRAELLEPPVGSRSTGLHSCSTIICFLARCRGSSSTMLFLASFSACFTRPRLNERCRVHSLCPSQPFPEPSVLAHARQNASRRLKALATASPSLRGPSRRRLRRRGDVTSRIAGRRAGSHGPSRRRALPRRRRGAPLRTARYRRATE